MNDQATELRRLARQAHAAGGVADCARARVIAVAGGKGGVGTTTIAVNLAVMLARQQHRTVLADVSAAGSDATALCRQAGRSAMDDVMTDARDIAEILEPGPAGVQVLPRPWPASEPWPTSETAQQRLVEQLHSLGPIADFVIVDAGNTPTPIARRLCQACDRVLLVATPALASIVNAYAAVKGLALFNGLVRVDTVVNMAPTEAVADDVHARLALACRRFLAIESRTAGHVCYANQVEEAGQRGEPFVVASPRSCASRQIAQLAARLVGSCEI